MTDRDNPVDRAAESVPAARFHGADGRAVRPCTPAAVTLRHIRMLDVPSGAEVLEIGTGSGYSAALLAHIVGPVGHVTTVDNNADLSKRAETLYAEHGHAVETVVADGILGHPPNAPYDRILVGTTPSAPPDAWLRQLRPGGAILTGVRLSALPGAYAIAHITVGDDRGPGRVTVHHGGYTPMTGSDPAPTAQATAPGRPDVVLTTLTDDGSAEALLTALRKHPHTEPSPAPGDDYFHLKNWLLATNPGGLLEAALDDGVGIGIGSRTPAGTAHAAVATDRFLVADAPESPALDALRTLIRQWHDHGSPRTHELRGRLERAGDAWRVRLARP
ncbi:methyltransferase domain-containing protein [Streptomyces chitinivorans]|uniref:Protein-L-isoaspartate O-methyltransferase n=1 Tax=Streptomyces chitinivorans TaxID=1257027 RepID=A0ABW7HTJ4_9ACTN|nr:methyltransferase domain-containing protein [Streptomyces chitinivorans]MDH2407296.1 methyltransferase domain-containing protein [Streptomyces chitinivorans]